MLLFVILIGTFIGAGYYFGLVSKAKDFCFGHSQLPQFPQLPQLPQLEQDLKEPKADLSLCQSCPNLSYYSESPSPIASSSTSASTSPSTSPRSIKSCPAITFVENSGDAGDTDGDDDNDDVPLISPTCRKMEFSPRSEGSGQFSQSWEVI